MKTLRKIPVTLVQVEYIPKELEDNTIYLSAEYSIAVHKCLCGCGELAAMPLNIKGETDGWNYSIDAQERVTFTPSVLNTHCPNRYHYIITNGIANVV